MIKKFKSVDEIQSAVREGWSLKELYKTLKNSLKSIEISEILAEGDFPKYFSKPDLESNQKQSALLFSHFILNQITIDKQVVTELNQFLDEDLILTCKALSISSAKALTEWKGESLHLRGLENLPPEIAETLAQWDFGYKFRFRSYYRYKAARS